MSDPFEIRLAFVSHLRHLQASQTSINKVVAYAMKFRTRKNVRDELWECILEECEKANLNARINIFYMVDSLCEASIEGIQKSRAKIPSRVGRAEEKTENVFATPRTSTNGAVATSSKLSNLAQTDSRILDDGYIPRARRDLKKLLALVVPSGSKGVLNRSSALQILDSWRTHRVFEPDFLEDLQNDIISRTSSGSKADAIQSISKEEILHRMDEDRERHKRLRERSWVLPTVSSTHSSFGNGSSGDPSPASPSPASVASPSFHPPVHGRIATSEKPSPLSPGAGLSQHASTGIAASPQRDRSLSSLAVTDAKDQEADAKLYLTPPSAAEVEFDQLWDETVSWNSDDESEAAAEIERWWPGCNVGRPEILKHWRNIAKQDAQT